jgi:hypothetical protein
MKKLKIICFLLPLILLSCDDKGIEEFKKNSIEVEATLSRKEIRGKRKKPEYYFYLMYFTNPDKAKQKVEKPKNEKLTADEIIANFKINTNMGSFLGRELRVNYAEFEKYEVGAKIPILYYKTDSTRIQLKEYFD